jgi:hypothetical protein
MNRAQRGSVVAVALLLGLGCSGPPGTSNGHDSPPKPDVVVIRNCRFLDPQDATLDLAVTVHDLRTALTWTNFRSVSAVDSAGEIREVGASYSRPESAHDAIRLSLHLNERPSHLIISELVTVSGPKARVESDSVDDLVNRQTRLGLAAGTISELRATNDGVVLAISFNDDGLAIDEDWEFLGLDDVRIRQGSQQWVTQSTYSEPDEDEQLTQFVGLAPLRRGEFDVESRFVLTAGGVAIQRMARTRLAWPSDCQPP